MTAPPLSVLIVEDDPRLLADLQRTVAALPGLAPITAVGTVADARRVIESEAGVGLMLVDLGLPDGHGARLIRLLRSTTPAARVLVLSMFDDEAYVLAALAAGADGYLLKEASGDAIARAMRDVLAGDAPLSPRIARHLLRRFEQPARGASRDAQRLSAREAEVLNLVADGHTAPEIASRLGLSLHTVNTHLRNSYAKLDASNRAQAVKRARDSGQIGT